MLPIANIVSAGQRFGEALTHQAEGNRRRHQNHPQRVLWPRFFAYLNWFLVVLWIGITIIGWVAFDETSDIGDLRTRWAFYPFGLLGIVLLLFYYNQYVESHDDHLVYRTWFRRVRRIDYRDIVAYRFATAENAGGLRLWTKDGKNKYFQIRIFDLGPAINYVQEHDVEDRTKPARWWR